MNEQWQVPGPKVTLADINREIKGEYYFTAREGVLGELTSDGFPATAYEQTNLLPIPLGLLTFCVLVLRNGYTVTGESACVSPENFNAQYGRDLARMKAIEKCWPLMGYALACRLADERRAAKPAPDSSDGLQPHQQRVIEESRELSDKLSKLFDMIQSPTFKTLPEAERVRLLCQAQFMSGYASVLEQRITAFTA